MFGTQQGGTITTTQRRQLPEWLEPAAMQATTGSQNYYQNYQSNPLTLQGLQGLGNIASNPGQIPGYDASLANYQGLMSGDYLYGGDAFNAAQQAAANRIIPQVQGAFNRSGRLNSGLAQSELTRQLGDSFAGLYGQERANQMQGLSMAPQMFQLGAAPSQLAYQTGQLSDAEAEGNLDDYIRRLQGVGNIQGDLSTDTPWFENPLAEALGLGLTGAGLLQALFGEGSGGGALGGLSDFFGLAGGDGGGGGGGIPPVPASAGDVSGIFGDQGLGSDPLNAGSGLGQDLGSMGGSVFQNPGAIPATAGEIAGTFPGLGSLVGSTGLTGSGAAVSDLLGGLGLGNASEITGSLNGLGTLADFGLGASSTGSGGLAAGAQQAATGGGAGLFGEGGFLGMGPGGALSAGILGGVAAPFLLQSLFGSSAPEFRQAQGQLAQAAFDGQPIEVGGRMVTPDRNAPMDVGFRTLEDPTIKITPLADGTFRLDPVGAPEMTETPQGDQVIVNPTMPTISNQTTGVTQAAFGNRPSSEAYDSGATQPAIVAPQYNPFSVGSQRFEDFDAARFLDRRFVDEFGNPLRGGN